MVIKKLSELHPWEKNPKNISEKAFKRLIEELKLGQHSTLLIMSDGTILGGNQRYRAMKEIGIESAKCIVVDFQNEAEDDGPQEWIAILDGEPQRSVIFETKEAAMLAYSISHNDSAGYYSADLLSSLGEEYKLDLEKYAVNFYELKTIDEQLAAMGVNKTQGHEDQNPPGATVVASSKRGEIYQLGNHRLMCGDATNLEDVTKLMGGVKADMIFTDPPYNIDYTGKTKDSLKILNDSFKNTDAFYKFLYDSFVNMVANSKDGAVFYVCHADTERVNFTKAYQDAGIKLAEVIIWKKQHFTFGRQDYQWQHEPILYGWKEGQGHYFIGDRKQTTIWEFDRPSSSKEHPTMKPITLIVNALNNNSKAGDLVLDVFGGSGSTLIACQQTNRNCAMMEIDPAYCDVIRKRYAIFLEKGDEWESLTPSI